MKIIFDGVFAETLVVRNDKLMNRLITILFLFTLTNVSSMNTVDNIKTAQDVERFFQNTLKFNFYLTDITGLYRDPYNQRIADSLNTQTWQKTDFNLDGKTDLLAYGVLYGKNSLVVYVSGLNHGTTHILTAQDVNICFPEIVSIGNRPLIVLHKANEFHREQSPFIKSDSLVYMFGTFIEYNSALTDEEVKSISLNSVGRKNFFSQPDLTETCISIEQDGAYKYKTNFRRIHLKKSKYEEKFEEYILKGKLDLTPFDEGIKLFELVRYLNIRDLPDTISVINSNEIIYELIVEYDDLVTKSVFFQLHDTKFGVNELFDRLESIRTSVLLENQLYY